MRGKAPCTTPLPRKEVYVTTLDSRRLYSEQLPLADIGQHSVVNVASRTGLYTARDRHRPAVVFVSRGCYSQHLSLECTSSPGARLGCSIPYAIEKVCAQPRVLTPLVSDHKCRVDFFSFSSGMVVAFRLCPRIVPSSHITEIDEARKRGTSPSSPDSLTEACFFTEEEKHRGGPRSEGISPSVRKTL